MEEIKKYREMGYKSREDWELLCSGRIDDFDFEIKSCGNYPCAYVKIPEWHKYYKCYYTDIDIDVHGGLTYGSKQNENEFWIGWDYAHFGDFTYDSGFFEDVKDRKYTVDMILKDVREVIKQLTET